MKSYLINQNDAGQRVSKFVEKTVPALPPSLLYKYFRLKRIKLNKKRCQPQDRLQAGDLVELYINDEFFGEGRQDLAFLKVPDKLTIIYEDENILLVDKKPGLVVHEDDDNTPDTLINRILHYLYNKGEYNPQAEQSFVPALCNRIDRNTGGIVMAAKNAEAEQKAQDILAEWESGDATEDSFAALANEYSEDPGSNTTGGLYEQVYQGQMMTEFNDWCFDPARKPGDTGIVYSESTGYHIMYFVGYGTTEYWHYACENAMISNEYSEWQTSLMDSVTAETAGGMDYVGF